MNKKIETVLFESGAVIDYKDDEIKYVQGFPYFYSCIRKYFNPVLLVSFERNWAKGLIEKLKLDNKDIFFGNRICYIDAYNEEECIDLRIRRLLTRSSITFRFDLARSILITGNYDFYNTSVAYGIKTIVIRPDISDIDSVYAKALYSYKSYADQRLSYKDEDIVRDVFNAFFKGE